MLAAIGAVVVFGIFSAIDTVVPAKLFVQNDAALPDLSAHAWQVFLVETGEVLFAHNADEVLPIASVTKLFTAANMIERGDLSASTTIVWGDVITEGRAGKLAYGEEYTNRELLFPLLLESSNDAATAFLRVHPTLLDEIALYTDGVALTQTVIADPSGLSDKNVSTATELAKVLRYIYFTHPEVFDITRLSSYYSKDNGWINNSPFVDDDGYLGGKHGFTYEAGRTAAVIFEESLGDEKKVLGYILLRSEDLSEDMNELRSFVQQNVTYR